MIVEEATLSKVEAVVQEWKAGEGVELLQVEEEGLEGVEVGFVLYELVASSAWEVAGISRIQEEADGPLEEVEVRWSAAREEVGRSERCVVGGEEEGLVGVLDHPMDLQDHYTFCNISVFWDILIEIFIVF